MKLVKIEKIEYSGPVMNLRTKKNHNYYANNILVSNCHGAASRSIQSIAFNCKAADYRLGFTGTMPDVEVDAMNIQSALGPDLYEILSNQLIDQGVLSRMMVANILLKYPDLIVEQIKAIDKKDKKSAFQQEINIVYGYEGRNKVFDWIFSHIKDGQNSLILTGLIDKHLKPLEEYLRRTLDKKYQLYVIHGGIDADEREAIRQIVEKSENCIVLASYGTMSTGVNIKKLHNIIFASSYKSKIRILQSIGRGLRLHGEKDKLIVWDLIDSICYMHRITKGPRKGILELKKNYLYEQFEERIGYYQRQGFEFVTKEFQL